jgi:AIR synthase-related protein
MVFAIASLAQELKASLGILHKQDIQVVSQHFQASTAFPKGDRPSNGAIHLGDDCAAIPDGEGYLLLAAEGMVPFLVQDEPWFAGWCAVMANVSDIYAMGGQPIALVDTLWSQSEQFGQQLWAGIEAAAKTYRVPIVGGHTNCHSPYHALSVAMLGRARSLLSSFNARPGDQLLVAIDFQGKLYGHYPFWNAATDADPDRLNRNLSLLPQLAESGLCDAAKDISMGGILGTLLMLLETSHCGAQLHLDRIPIPQGLSLVKWLGCFPSYGFLLSVRPDRVDAVQSMFRDCDLVCEAIGEVCSDQQLILQSQQECIEFWNFQTESLTGFSARSFA